MSVGGEKLIRRLRSVVSAALVAGAMTLIAPASAQAGDVEYGYDSAGRLISARYPNDTLVLYTYDAASNRTRRLAESCVGPELAPTAVNDTLNVYITPWYNEENATWYCWANSDAVNLLANDSDPSSFSLVITSLDAGEGPFYLSDGWFFYEMESNPGYPPTPALIEYTISNGHCQTDTATISVSYTVM